jgi:HlyD family secretion protein
MAISKKRRRLIVLSIAVLIVVGLAWVVVFRKKEPVITVQTEKVERRNLTEVVVANGKIQPVIQVKISPEVSGEIVELPVKEGQQVQKGDLILKINPDVYIAARNQAEANFQSSLAGRATAEANLRKAEADFNRSKSLFVSRLIPENQFDQDHAAFDVAQAQLTNAADQVEMAKASLASAEEELAKTTIGSPLTGTISKLNSQLGERVLGTVENVGTEIMTIADLNQMEARVDVGETDVVLIRPGQKARLEVDAFRDRKFIGVVTDIANSSKGSGTITPAASSQTQEATKFEVRIRFSDQEAFRPGMSVSAEIETRYRTNALTVPMASVTTRVAKPTEKGSASGKDTAMSSDTNSVVSADPTNAAPLEKKSRDASPPAEVVFVVEGNHVKMVPVKIGISDDNYWEITDGLVEGQEVVAGGYRAISRDLEDGKKIRKGPSADMEPKT